MPNSKNFEAPITLFGFGRSGTSLLQDLFDRHPDVYTVGETTGLIFDGWSGLQQTLPNTQARYVDGRRLSTDDHAVSVLRNVFLQEYMSLQRFWMHKPIGFCPSILFRLSNEALNEVASWYWGAIDSLFPQSTHLLILREPLDIIESAVRYWDYPADKLTQQLLWLTEIMIRAPRPLSVIHLDALIADPKKMTYSLLTRCGLKFDPVVMSAFKVKHAAFRGSFGQAVAEDRQTSEDFSYRSRDATSQVDSAIFAAIRQHFDQLMQWHLKPPKRKSMYYG